MVNFTIIIPFHVNDSSKDRLPMMDELIDSMPDRSDPEVIWIDDHSSVTWRPKPQKNTIHKYLSTPDGQRFAGPARNLGLNHASGTWVMFADNDDIITTDVLNTLFDKILEQNNTDPKDLYIGKTEAFDITGKEPSRHLYANTIVQRSLEQKEYGWLAYHYGPWSKIIRKTFIQKNKLVFGPWLSGEDAYFSARLIFAKPRIDYFSTPFYNIREGHESITQKVNKDALYGALQAHFDVQNLLRANNKHRLERPPLKILKTHFPTYPWLVTKVFLMTSLKQNPLLSIKSIIKKLQYRLTTRKNN